jgi:large subunit ribosomal protein L6
MSKIGRSPIKLAGATVSHDGLIVKIKGPKAEFEHELPVGFSVELEDGFVNVLMGDSADAKQGKALWGLHRALLANKVTGSEIGFTRSLKIVGLGFKAIKQGADELVFSLGFSHKVNFKMPKSVTVEIDKTGQNLTFASVSKFELGNVTSSIRALKKPEPYKGTGIMYTDEIIHRKAGKSKS